MEGRRNITGHRDQLEFRVDEIMVHPTFGLCRIHAITSIEMNNRLEQCYVLLVGSPHHQTKVFIPVTQAGMNGLRPPVTKREAEEIFQIFQSSPEFLDGHFQEQCLIHLNSENVFQVAGAIRNLLSKSVYRWGETERIDSGYGYTVNKETLLKRALRRLMAELAFTQGVSQKEVEKHIQQCLKRNHKMPKATTTEN